MSPTTQLVHKKVMMDRARLLLDGRDLDLMKRMSRDEIRCAMNDRFKHAMVTSMYADCVLFRATTDWLHDFWMFSFVTTKYWGKGPKHWTLPLIRFKTLAGFINGSSEHQQGRSQAIASIQSSSMATGVIDTPSQLCNWLIHIDNSVEYDPIDSRPTSPASEDGNQFDIEDESTWREWDAQDGQDLTSTITEGLQANAFTNHQAEDMPLSTEQIVNKFSGSIQDAKVEAIGFAIMTRNSHALSDLLVKRDFNQEALRSISPFHLAAKFLDGSKACCRVILLLCLHLDGETSIGVNYTDNLGLTILDTLFMSILRSHSSVSPTALGSFSCAPGLGFEGVDVDVCGRWDADSPCVRQLHATGATDIPHEWKHMFCHTSAQAVCHCLTTMFIWAPHINTASGLFQRRCQSCGSDLKLGPLHAFVVVCFHLASAGRQGETLFGMLACLVCLLTWRADPLLPAQISLPAILGLGETGECQHQYFNAAELASAVPVTIVNAWTPEVKLGWEAITEVLNHCARQAQTKSNTTNVSSNMSETPGGFRYNYEEYSGRVRDSGSTGNGEPCQHEIHQEERDIKMALVMCGDKSLGIIWAAIQVELLTYRRLEVGGSWLSSEFDVQDVVEGLRASNDSVLMRLVENRGEGAVKEFSTCGFFLKADCMCRPAMREEACATYFSNLDDWKRSTFLLPNKFE